jgi:hypothetical protein
MRLTLKILLWGVAVLLLAAVVSVLAAFVYQNSAWVLVELPVFGEGLESPVGWFEQEMHLGAGLVGAYFAGVFSVLLLVLIPLGLRRGFERKRQKRFISTLEGELTDLRNLPVKSPAPFEDLEDLPAPSDEPATSDQRLSVQSMGKRKASWRQLDDDALMVAALQEDDSAPSRPLAGRGKQGPAQEPSR